MDDSGYQRAEGGRNKISELDLCKRCLKKNSVDKNFHLLIRFVQMTYPKHSFGYMQRRMNRIPLKTGLMEQKVVGGRQQLQGVHKSFHEEDMEIHQWPILA
jgi:hypothetical protein